MASEDLRGCAFSTPAPRDRSVQVRELERQIANLSLECSRIEQEILQASMGASPVQHDRLRDFSSENVSARECDGNYRGMNDSTCISRSVIRRNEMKPPKFDGSCEIKEFFVQFDQVARWNGWTVGECASQLIMSLQGPARQILNEISMSNTHDFYILKETLENRFSPRERVSSYKVEFKTKRRQTGESVADFGHSLRRLAIKAYPNCSFASLETHVIDQFIYGIGDIDLRKHVQFNHPSTIDKAIALAVEYESFVGKCDERRKPVMNHVRFEDEFASRTQNNVEKDDMAKIIREEIQKALGSHRSRNNNGAYQSSYSNAFDLRNDHVQNQSRNYGSSERQLGERRSQIICYHCQEIGHIAPRCPKKLENTHNNVPSSNSENSQGLALGPRGQS